MNPMDQQTVLTKEQAERVDQIEHMNRAQRRALGKQIGAKIPGKNLPNVNTRPNPRG